MYSFIENILGIPSQYANSTITYVCAFLVSIGVGGVFTFLLGTIRTLMKMFTQRKGDGC